MSQVQTTVRNVFQVSASVKEISIFQKSFNSAVDGISYSLQLGSDQCAMWHAERQIPKEESNRTKGWLFALIYWQQYLSIFMFEEIFSDKIHKI